MFLKAIYRWFNPTAEFNQKTNLIDVKGINTANLIRDIERVYSTSSITKSIFTNIKSTSFSIEQWWIPDLYFTLSTLLDFKDRKTKKSNIKDLMVELKENTWFSRYFAEYPSILDYNKLNEMKFTPLPQQMELFKAYDNKLPKLNLKGFQLAAGVGTGKGIRKSEFIKIPGGWKMNKDIKVGDYITAKDGTATKVIGVHPQGLKPIYKITFADGRETICDEDHLWKIYHVSKPNRNGVVDTIELKRRIDTNSRKVYYIDLCDSEQIDDVPLLIDPYLLGVMIGDSNYSSDSTVKLLGIFNNSHCQKSIPDIYLNASHRQRLALIQGLMDTDGAVDAEGRSSYSTSSLELATQVQYLFRSIGAISYMSEKDPWYVYLRKRLLGRKSFNIYVQYKTPNELFTLPEKKERLGESNQYSNELKLRIESVEYVGMEETQCISIEHPDKLYVIKDFVVTHNTYMALSISAMVHSNPIIVVCPKFLVDRVWMDEVKMHYKKPKKIWKSTGKDKPKPGYDIYIVHYDYLGKFLDFIKTIKLKNPVIILDESHNLNDSNSMRARLYITLCKGSGSKNILHLSGTAIRALGMELSTLFCCIDDYFTETVEGQFKKVYGRSANRATAILNNRFGLVSHKIESGAVMGDVKLIKKEILVKVKNSERFTLPYIRNELQKYIVDQNDYYQKHMKEYEQQFAHCISVYERTLKTRQEKNDLEQYLAYVKVLRNGFNANDHGQIAKWCASFERNKIRPSLNSQDRKTFDVVKSIIKYLKMVIVGKFLGSVLGKRRVEAANALVDNVNLEKIIGNAEKKTIIFTDYVPTLLHVNNDLISKGFEPLLIYGETNKFVGEIINDFKENERKNPLVATYKSLSVGVTIIQANTVVTLNDPFRQADLTQAVARAYRKGQTEDCYHYSIILDTGNVPNVSTRNKEIMEWSRTLCEEIIGSGVKVTDEELQSDIFIRSHFNQTRDSGLKSFMKKIGVSF